MLKTFNNSADCFGISKNIKCAEVFCQSAENFSIICSFCDMKIFDFVEFWEHFRNLHLRDDIKSLDEMQTNNDENVIQIKHETIDIPTLYDTADEFDAPFAEAKPIIFTSEPDNVIDWLNATPTDSENDFNENEFEDDADDDSEYQPKVFKKSKSKKDVHTTYNCPECDKIYKTEKTLKKHLSDCHNKNESNYKCFKCNLAFDRLRLLQEHLQEKHGGYPCPDCDKIYKSNDALRVHRYKHSGERNFVCDIDDCGKTFYNPKNLCAHKRLVHLAGRNLVCEICGHRTKVKSALELHKRSHTGEKPYICKTCGKAFRSSSLLKEHQPMHSTERPHICDVCGATFSRPKALYHHKHLHLDVKKYVCKLCGKAYAQAAGLCGHMRQHKAEQF